DRTMEVRFPRARIDLDGPPNPSVGLEQSLACLRVSAGLEQRGRAVKQFDNIYRARTKWRGGGEGPQLFDGRLRCPRGCRSSRRCEQLSQKRHASPFPV